MAEAASGSLDPFIDMDYAWFIAPEGQSAIYEGGFITDGRLKHSGIPFDTVLQAYRAAGKNMLVLQNGSEKGITGYPNARIAIDISRVIIFSDARAAKSIQGRETSISFKGTSAGCAVDMNVDAVTQLFLEARPEQMFLRLVQKNRHDEGLTYYTVNFEGARIEPSDERGSKLFIYGESPHPLYVAQTAAQIEAALAAGEKFAMVPLPDGPVRNAAVDQAVVTAGKGGPAAKAKKLKT